MQRTPLEIHLGNQPKGNDIRPHGDRSEQVIVLSSSKGSTRGTNAGTTQRASNRQSRSYGATNGGVLPLARGKQGGARTFALPFIDGIAFCGKRDAFEVEDYAPSVGPGITQRSGPMFAPDRPSPPQTREPEENKISGPVSNAEGDRRQLADTQAVEKGSVELHQEIEIPRRSLSKSHSRITGPHQHCDAQSRDQIVSNSFFNITDTSSDTDVIRVLQRLNAETQQNATYIADCLIQEFEFKNIATEVTTEQVSPLERVIDHIGSILTISLASKPHELPFLLQVAFQGYITALLGRIASAWSSDPGLNSFINDIYQTLCAEEAQITCGRWRSLARVYNVQSHIGHAEPLVETLIEGLSDILMIAGCTAPRSAVISKITSRFKEKVILLVELAVRLNKIFDEVLSSDYEVLLVQPGDEFEGEIMEEADGESGIQQGSIVLCTTHLGLIKRIPVGTLWEKGQKQQMTVLKAMVLLEGEGCSSEEQMVEDENSEYHGLIAQGRFPRRGVERESDSDSDSRLEGDKERLPRKKW